MGACRSRSPVVVVGDVTKHLEWRCLRCVAGYAYPLSVGQRDTVTRRRMARASRVAGRLRKFSPGERDLGVLAPDTRYNITTSSGTITGCAAFYQLIAGFPNRRKDSTMFVMTARAP